jgi:lipid-A-disaccharide synthase
MHESQHTIIIVVGEASGDALGAGLIAALKKHAPQLKFAGIGGPAMLAQGFDSWYPQEWLALRGLAEVLPSVPKLLKLRAELTHRITTLKPALFIGIDAPDFNLGLEKKLKNTGIKTLHYVCPSLWAWREKRVQKLKDAVDHLLSVFPFESELLRKHEVAHTFVGHRLADRPLGRAQQEAMRERFQLRAHPVFALLPGSRASELHMHAKLYFEVAKRLHAQYPDAHFLVPLATRATRDQWAQMQWQHGAQDLPMTLLYGHAEFALTAADVALVASGTASLEAALCECPQLITYKVSRLTYWWVKSKLRLPYVGLPNILSRAFIVPELLQSEASTNNVVQALANIWEDRAFRELMTEKSARLKASLQANTSMTADEMAALAVLSLMS